MYMGSMRSESCRVHVVVEILVLLQLSLLYGLTRSLNAFAHRLDYSAYDVTLLLYGLR